MGKKYDDDTFLAKWANGTLSKKALKEFEDSGEQALYETILDGTDALEIPAYDKEQLFQKVKAQKTADTKTVRLIPKWVYGVAATVAVLIGAFLFFDQGSMHSTSFGEKLIVQLPDGSEAVLNANSELDYAKVDWDKKRELTLNGEAFFKVKKGSTFTVNTTYGAVTVLGTQFTASTYNAIFEVNCFEGKVQVASKGKTETIGKGEAVRFVDGKVETWDFSDQNQPTWIQEESSFTNAPLKQVVKALENQYGVHIDASKVNQELRYTGSFTHTDLKKALKTVFNPLEITFTFANKDTIVLGKE